MRFPFGRGGGTEGSLAPATGSHRRRPRSLASLGRARVGAALGLAVVAVLGAGAGVRELEQAPVVTAPDIGALPSAPAPTTTTPASPEPRPRRTAAGPPAAGALAAVPPAVPTEVDLPGQRVTAPVVPIGVRPSGQLDLPESPRTVGWWVGSAPAGSPKPTVLAGHVDARATGVGALAALRDVTAGSPIVLTDAFGGRHAYQVSARRTYPKYALPRTVFTAAPLVLITCGGPFDEKTGSYRDNIVVYATPA
jgi:Sortase domain